MKLFTNYYDSTSGSVHMLCDRLPTQADVPPQDDSRDVESPPASGRHHSAPVHPGHHRWKDHSSTLVPLGELGLKNFIETDCHSKHRSVRNSCQVMMQLNNQILDTHEKSDKTKQKIQSDERRQKQRAQLESLSEEMTEIKTPERYQSGMRRFKLPDDT